MVSIAQRAPEAPAPRASAIHGPVAGIRGVVLVAIAIVVVMWLVAMSWGWRLDETLSAWVTGDRLTDAVTRAQEYQGQSPLYFAFLWSWRQVVGGSEFWLRVPSALAVGAAAWHLFHLGREMDRDVTGWVAAGTFLTTANVAFRATTARPYAFAVLLAVWSMRLLWSWVQKGDRRSAYGWAVASAGMLYLTPFAVLVLLVHGGVLVAYRRRVLPLALPVVSLAVILVIPLAPQVMSLAGRASSLVTSAQPSPAQAMIDVVPLGALVVVAVAVLLRRPDDPWSRGPTAIAAGWALTPPAILLLAGTVTGDPLWVSRYWVAAAPGLALIAGMAVARVGGPADHLPRAVILTALLMAQGILAMHAHAGDHRQTWSEAIEWARTETEGEAPLTLINSGLVEALDPDEVSDPDSFAYLSAPARVYGMDEPILPLPLGRSSTAEEFLAGMDIDADTVVLIAPPELGIWPDYETLVTERLLPDGYELTGPVRPLDDVRALVFRRRAG